ncbi:nitronate monooxygenase [Serinicoccus kebangsaanensis]|uniref:nitronate monooxygenase n=1 Tax=Serinicoccus kebangsaanensis TaxID=2602069 RepID=UPI00124F5DE8|nr:nitronate monooxygenase [Serinicoccus kebangsaanensis]
MQRGEELPRVWIAPGAVDDVRGLLRFGSLDRLLVPVGPVVAEHAGAAAPGPALVHGPGPGGVEHDAARGIPLLEAVDRLRWCATRGLRTVVVVRGQTPSEPAALAGRLCRGLEGDAVGAVEVDLRAADDQQALKVMARLREETPRDLLLLARLSALQADLVGVARGAVAGGAGAVVVCGSVPLGRGRWWSGPSTGAISRSGVQALAQAAQEQRWPPVPMVAAGGVHDPDSADAALAAGAVAVQLGTALWADPTVLWSVAAHLEGRGDPADRTG